MKHNSGIVKRFAAALLAVILTVTYSDIGSVLHALAAGDITASVTLAQLIAVTDRDNLSSSSKAILQSPALVTGDAVSINIPTESQVSVAYSDKTKKTVITVSDYASGVGSVNWEAVATYVDGNEVKLTNGSYTETKNPFFTEVVVEYELELTAKALGVTSSQLLTAMNTPYELATDYQFQKNTLNNFVAAMAVDGNSDPLAALAMLNDVDLKTYSGFSMTLKDLLASLELLNKMLKLGLGKNALSAAAQLHALIPDNGYIPLYFTMQNYLQSGMYHYYTNEQTYLDQLTELNDIMTTLVADKGFYGLLNMMGYTARFEKIRNGLNAVVALEKSDNRIRTDLIDVSSGALSKLLDLLDTAQTAKYSSAPSILTWTERVKKAGPESATYTMNVIVDGVTKTETQTVSAETVIDAEAWARSLVDKSVLENEKYYDLSVKNVGKTYTYTWTQKQVPLYIEGTDVMVGTVSLSKRDIYLEPYTGIGYIWKYYIGTNQYLQGNTYTLSMNEIKALMDGELAITRSLANFSKREVTAMVNSMGENAVLAMDQYDNYTIVLKLDSDNYSECLMEALFGLYMSNYSYMELGDEVFIKDGQFHFQALINALMNSGLGTESVKALVDDKGNVNNLMLSAAEIVSNYDVPDGVDSVAMGGVLIKTTLEFGMTADDTIPAVFYITLDESGVKKFKEKVISIEKNQGITFACENGSFNTAVALDDKYYTAYAAGLTMAGEADIRNINQIKGEAAFGYLVGLLDPVMTNDSVSFETFENTFSRLGKKMDLEKYADLCDTLTETYKELEFFYGENSCGTQLTDMSVNSWIDSMAKDVKIPESFGDISLGSLVYEYKEDDETDADEYGLDMKIVAALNNLDKTYAALVISSADKTACMVTVDDLKTIPDATYIILLNNITADLTLKADYLDLNGKTITGNVTGSGLKIVDSAYETSGRVTGTVAGAEIMGGTYTQDVTSMLSEGYVQNSGSGKVTNELYSISGSGNDIVITLNSENVIEELASPEGADRLALDLVLSLLMHYYNAAELSIGGNQLYSMQFGNVMDLVSGSNYLGNMLDKLLKSENSDGIAALINTLVADLTDYGTLEASLEEGTPVSEYSIVMMPWEMKAEYVSDKDYIALKLGVSGDTETGSLRVVMGGNRTGEMAELAGILEETVIVSSELKLEDIVLKGTDITAKGSYTGSVELDLTEKDEDPDSPYYAILMAVIIAHDTNSSTVRNNLIEAIRHFYENRYDASKLRETFDTLRIKQIAEALGNTGRSESYTEMIADLGLSDVVTQIDDDALGMDLMICLLSELFSGANVSSTAKLGSVKRSDGGYGFSGSGIHSGSSSIVSGYEVKYSFSVDYYDAAVYLFSEHLCTAAAAVAENEIAVTCTEDGYYDSVVYCKVCGYELSRETITVPATGHTYVPVFSWTDDYTGCEVIFGCEHGDYEDTTVYTCEVNMVSEDGRKTCTASVTYHGVVYTDEKTITLITEIGDISFGSMAGLYGWEIDSTNSVIRVDLQRSGLTVETLRTALSVETRNDTDGNATIEISINGQIVEDSTPVVNGTEIKMTAASTYGGVDSRTYTIIVLGDINGNGRIESGDAYLMRLHFQNVKSLTGVAALAADVNRNGGCDSGDAVKNSVKYQSPGSYVSSLTTAK